MVWIEKCPFVTTRARLGSSSFASHYPSSLCLYKTGRRRTGTLNTHNPVSLSHGNKSIREESLDHFHVNYINGK